MATSSTSERERQRGDGYSIPIKHARLGTSSNDNDNDNDVNTFQRMFEEWFGYWRTSKFFRFRGREVKRPELMDVFLGQLQTYVATTNMEPTDRLLMLFSCIRIDQICHRLDLLGSGVDEMTRKLLQYILDANADADLATEFSTLRDAFYLAPDRIVLCAIGRICARNSYFVRWIDLLVAFRDVMNTQSIRCEWIGTIHCICKSDVCQMVVMSRAEIEELEGGLCRYYMRDFAPVTEDIVKTLGGL